jgi:type IV pilus assembly protein PilV
VSADDPEHTTAEVGVHHASRRRRAEDGVTLIELLVALLVLGVVMTGLVAVTISTLRVTVVNDTRTVASNLAQAELERVRALPFAELADVGRVEETRDGFEIVRDTSWVELDTDTDVCSEPGDSVATAMIRVDVSIRSVTQPSGSTPHVVSASTTIARPPVAPATDVGALSVLVLDHQVPPVGTGTVVVTVRGPAPSGAVRLQTTPASGCVLFTDLAPGDYEVELLRLGHVADGVAADRATPTVNASVQAVTRTNVELLYAPAGTARASWVTRDAGPAVLPVERPVTFARSTSTVLRTEAGVEVSPLFPGPWTLWAGDCAASDPQGIDTLGDAYWPGGARSAPTVVPPGGLVEGQAAVARVRWALGTVSGSVAAPQPVSITATVLPSSAADDPAEACGAGTATLTFPTASRATGELDNSGNVLLGLPYGDWRLTASNPNGLTATTDVRVAPTSTGVVNATGGG